MANIPSQSNELECFYVETLKRTMQDGEFPRTVNPLPRKICCFVG